MKSVAQRLADTVSEFSEFEDDFEKYSYLVEIAGLLEPYPNGDRDDSHLVRGCQSKVWISAKVHQGLFYFDADSDTRIIKGVLLVLKDIFDGAYVNEVAGFEGDVLEAIGLAAQFNSERQFGIKTVVNTLKEQAYRFQYSK